MKRIIVINWRWENYAIDSDIDENSVVKINDNDSVILTKFTDFIKYNTTLGVLLNKYDKESDECIVLTHYNSGSNSLIKIPKTDIKKPDIFNGNFIVHEFGGGVDKIYYGTSNTIGLLVPDDTCDPKGTIKKENFDVIWNYYRNELELDYQKKKLINTFQPLLLDIVGLSEMSDDKKKQEYRKEIEESFKNQISIYTEYLKEFEEFEKLVKTNLIKKREEIVLSLVQDETILNEKLSSFKNILEGIVKDENYENYSNKDKSSSYLPEVFKGFLQEVEKLSTKV